MRTFPTLLSRTLCAALLGLALHAHAQFGDNKASAALDKALLGLFGKTAFSATATLDVKGEQSVAMDMEFAMLDGQSRSVVDLSKIRSAMVPPEALAQLKAAGLDQVISITRRDRTSVLMIYPNAKAYTDFAPPGAEPVSDKEPKVTKTDLGEEKLDGQSHAKQKVVVTDEKGQTTEVLVWNNAKKFPMQLQTTLDGTTLTMRFKDVKETKPAAALFQAPAGYQKYGSPQELMMQVMMKSMPRP